MTQMSPIKINYENIHSTLEVDIDEYTTLNNLFNFLTYQVKLADVTIDRDSEDKKYVVNRLEYAKERIMELTLIMGRLKSGELKKNDSVYKNEEVICLHRTDLEQYITNNLNEIFSFVRDYLNVSINQIMQIEDDDCDLNEHNFNYYKEVKFTLLYFSLKNEVYQELCSILDVPEELCFLRDPEPLFY